MECNATNDGSSFGPTSLRADRTDGQRPRRCREGECGGHEPTFDGLAVMPYSQAESFDGTRFDRWNRRLYQAGVEVEISKTWRIEPYRARPDDSVSATGNADPLGLVLRVYH